MTCDDVGRPPHPMKERFAGVEGHRLLVDVLRDNKLVTGNAALAEEIADAGELLDLTEKAVLIEQDRDDNDVYLILSGAFVVLVNGKPVARRTIGDHVGEMAAIQPTQRRSATVMAQEPSVVLRLTEPQFSGLGGRHPEVFRGGARIDSPLGAPSSPEASKDRVGSASRC